jgi:uncharacterized protein YggE
MSRIMFATLVALGLGGCAHGSGQSGQLFIREEPAGIVVVGRGKAEARPDVAILQLGVEARRPTVAAAREAAAQAQTALLAALRANGVAEDRIQTQAFSVQPDFDYAETGRRLRGYVVSQSIRVRASVDEQLGAAIDAAVSAAGDEVRFDGISFEVSDPAAVRAQARERAVADARRVAEELARHAGVELGEPIAIEEVGASVPGPYMMRAEAADTATPIAPGMSETELEVRVRFAIVE